jgi:23S rRNA pseudouridine955/2504/2580 synthase
MKHPTHNSSSDNVQYRQIDADHVGQRLDNYLFSSCKGVPKSHIYRLVRQGQVRINRGRRRVDYRLRLGDVVRIPPLRVAAPSPIPPSTAAQQFPIEQCIVHEDDDLLAIDKPAGLAVHGGSGLNLGLIETLRAQRPHARFLELVHRLDRDTSGVLLVAKRRSALTALHEALRTGRVEKRYIALVRNHWPAHAQQVTAPLHKFQLRSGERMVEVSGAGKEAATRFVAKRRFSDSTLVEIELLTGRTHQARVHAAYAGHPIAGDVKYGEREFNRLMRQRGLRRLFLHASRLRFKHPGSGRSLIIVAPLPTELAKALKTLTEHDASV